jgi:hypothetical protein
MAELAHFLGLSRTSQAPTCSMAGREYTAQTQLSGELIPLWREQRHSSTEGHTIGVLWAKEGAFRPTSLRKVGKVPLRSWATLRLKWPWYHAKQHRQAQDDILGVWHLVHWDWPNRTGEWAQVAHGQPLICIVEVRSWGRGLGVLPAHSPASLEILTPGPIWLCSHSHPPLRPHLTPAPASPHPKLYSGITGNNCICEVPHNGWIDMHFGKVKLS